MTNTHSTVEKSWEDEFDKKCRDGSFGMDDPEGEFDGELFFDEEKIKSFIHQKLTLARADERKRTIKAVDENISINQSSHRVGAHSDDWGGESDYPCDGAKCEHTICCRVLSDAILKIKEKEI